MIEQGFRLRPWDSRARILRHTVSSSCSEALPGWFPGLHVLRNVGTPPVGNRVSVPSVSKRKGAALGDSSASHLSPVFSMVSTGSSSVTLERLKSYTLAKNTFSNVQLRGCFQVCMYVHAHVCEGETKGGQDL